LKKIIFIFISFYFSKAVVAQITSVPVPGGMHQKVLNFDSFSTIQIPIVTDELVSLTPTHFQSHPEFGKVPYNTQCNDCIELLDKRTEGSRYFVKNGTNGNVFFVQQGKGELHYKDVNNNFITVDTRLRPHPAKANFYYAPDQHMPTLLDANTGSTSIQLGAFELVFNLNPKVYHIDQNTETQVYGNINLANTTVGDDGAFSGNAWSGINRTVAFSDGSIKTNFILYTIPVLPTGTGWLAFEDEIVIPAGYKIIKDSIAGNFSTPEGYWNGDLKLVHELSGNEMARWGSVVVSDGTGNLANANNSAFQIKKIANTYFIRAMVNVSLLNNPATIYPVTVDPLVSGTNTWSAGLIGFTPYSPGNGFCGASSAFCLGGPLNVTFPGAATITNVLWSSSYQAVAPTVMGDGGFRMVGPCGENPTSGNSWWNCGGPPASSGTCSGVNNVVPNLAVGCMVASCSPTVVPFRIKNIHCNNVVAGACNTARLRTLNNSWIVTVQGQNLSTLTNTTTGNGTTTVNAVCLSTVVLNPNPLYSVGPYTFSWTPGGQTTPTRTYSPTAPGTVTITCRVTDACGVVRTATFVVSNTCTLPLELTDYSLNYNGEACEVNWTTATEKNTDYFLVEKSYDGNVYTVMEKIQAAVNSSQQKNYSVFDLSPAKDGLTYYRLKLFDQGNDVPRLNLVKTLNINEEKTQIKVQPNPASDYLDIYFPQNFLKKNVVLQVFDNTGKRVLIFPVNKTSSKSAYNLNLETLISGVYTLRLIDESGNTSKATFIKN